MTNSYFGNPLASVAAEVAGLLKRDVSPDDIQSALLRPVGTASGADQPARPEERDSQLEAALDRAAVLGVFSVEDLLRSGGGTAAPKVRSGLLRRSYPAPKAKGFRILDVEIRDACLAGLRRTGGLFDVLEATPVAASDASGQALRRQLVAETPAQRSGVDTFPTGDNERLPSGSGALKAEIERTREQLRVSSWVAPENSEPRSLLRQRLAVLELQAQWQTEADAFVGREAMLDEIENALVSDEAREAALRDRAPPTVVLHGVGGIGKSSLLAKLVERLQSRDARLLFAHIDLDRPGFGAAPQGFITAEAGRQLGAQLGDADLVTALAAATAQSDSRLESIVIAVDEKVQHLQLGDLNGAGARPVLFIIDTFEERQRFGPAAVQAIGGLLAQLGDPNLGPISRLLVVIAGRSPVRPEELTIPARAFAIEELDHEDRAELLRTLGNSATDAAEIADWMGNPLIIKLLSRLMQKQGGGNNVRLDAARRDPEVVQGLVYDRILYHIEDPDARELAYPGLVLREVSPDIIRKVMAPVCLKRTLAEAEAERLFEALKREAWLLEPGGNGRLIHGGHIRRLMMRFLQDDVERAGQRRNLHQRARAYFAEAGNERERDYHFAMLGRQDELAECSPAEASRIHANVGLDEEFLKPAVLAILRAKAGLPLSDEDIERLPAALWDTTMDRVGTSILRREDYARLQRLWERRPEGTTDRARLWLRLAQDALVLWDTPEATAFYRHGASEADLIAVAEAAALSCLRREETFPVYWIAASYLRGPNGMREGPRPAPEWGGWLAGLSQAGVAGASSRNQLAAAIQTILYGWVALNKESWLVAEREQFRADAQQALSEAHQLMSSLGFERTEWIALEALYRAFVFGLYEPVAAVASRFAFRVSSVAGLGRRRAPDRGRGP